MAHNFSVYNLLNLQTTGGSYIWLDFHIMSLTWFGVEKTNDLSIQCNIIDILSS